VTQFDYSDFADEKPGENMLAIISHAAKEQLDIETEIAQLEEQLEEAKVRLREVSWYKLPKLMDEARQQELTTIDGITVKVDENIRASIKEANEAKAFSFLEEAGQAGMIKREFLISFNRDEEQWAAKFQRDLTQRKKPVKAKIKRSVHSGTLSSWVKKELESGKDLPLDILGVFRQRVSKLTVKDQRRMKTDD